MGINTKHSVQAEFFERYITVGKLKNILNQLEDDWEILPNGVGNLSVFTTKSEPKGFIDIAEEVYEIDK